MDNNSATVIECCKLGPDQVRLGLDVPAIASSIEPGQFVHVSCGDINQTFLRRPFSLHRFIRRQDGGPPTGIEILFHVKGRGTRWLASRRPGDSVDILGPLGMGFNIKKNPDRDAIVIAGGVGVAPIPALVERLHAQNRKVLVLLGARTDSGILCESELRECGATVEVATEDGSRGIKGFVSRLLDEKLDTIEKSELFVCGPAPMMRAIAEMVADTGVSCQVSLEVAMACGVGACMGCTVPAVGGGYRRVCLEGPVFDAADIAWQDYIETVRRARL
ncbi:MAG: dihydroorotate dehydrogenase electron transfer subunit [Candidatus Hydrogenedentes bacterium]|nr:dihydroorotate dehydrogenase electron transfer subunit [Candidatus Hydrogenedentota bacterium]